MSTESLFGGRPSFEPLDRNRSEHLLFLQPLRRLLAFRGRTIDDVVNCRMVKNEIRLYWKFHKQIIRQGEIGELEKQWNSIPL